MHLEDAGHKNMQNIWTRVSISRHLIFVGNTWATFRSVYRERWSLCVFVINEVISNRIFLISFCVFLLLLMFICMFVTETGSCEVLVDILFVSRWWNARVFFLMFLEGACILQEPWMLPRACFTWILQNFRTGNLAPEIWQKKIKSEVREKKEGEEKGSTSHPAR